MDHLADALDVARRQADRVVNPDTRQRAYDSVHAFALQRPRLFSFLLIQAAFALPPLTLFTSFVLGVLFFALSCALFFVLFWMGIALAVLGALVLGTAGCAAVVWAWVVGGYMVGGFVYGLVNGGGGGGGAGGGGRSGSSGGMSKAAKDEKLLQAKWDDVVGGKKEAIQISPGVVEEDGRNGVIRVEGESEKEVKREHESS